MAVSLDHQEHLDFLSLSVPCCAVRRLPRRFRHSLRPHHSPSPRKEGKGKTVEAGQGTLPSQLSLSQGSNGQHGQHGQQSFGLQSR